MHGMSEGQKQGELLNQMEDLLRFGMDLIAFPAGAGSVERFEADARACIPSQHQPLFEAEVAAAGHGQYEVGDESLIAGVLDGLAAVDHALRGWAPVEHVDGPFRAWAPGPAPHSLNC